jgi:hypothetical protein
MSTPNPAISRAQVHFIGESCSADTTFEATAARLLKDQRRLSRFFELNAEPMGFVAAQTSMYMAAVCLRIFEKVGGRMRKINTDHLTAAQRRVDPMLAALLPLDEGFAGRARGILTRAQPNLLDEVLWALYVRADEAGQDAVLTAQHKAMMYIMLWTAVEAMDSAWQPPAGWTPESFTLPEGGPQVPEI